jgi:hypothetical protein
VQSYNAVWDQDFLGMYKRLDLPLLIGAAPDDVLHAFLGRAQELQPGAHVVDLAGANFEPDLDAETLSRALRSFLYTE